MRTTTLKLVLTFTIIVCTYLPLQAEVHTLNQATGTISLHADYTDGMNEEWNINTGTNKLVKFTFTFDTDEDNDWAIIYSVDNAGNLYEAAWLSGAQSGTVSTILPTGKAKIVFISDDWGSYPDYGGFDIQFAVDDSYSTTDNLYVPGNVIATKFIKPGGTSYQFLKADGSIDANQYFFTILYKGNRVVINRKKINYNQSELNDLLKIKTDKELADGKLTLKDIESQKITDNAMIADNYKYEIDHIRYCTGKYKNEITTGYVFSLLGTATVTSTLYMKKETLDDLDNIKLVSNIGYGLGIIGTILIIDSNKWMKRINVGPDGIGLRYKF